MTLWLRVFLMLLLVTALAASHWGLYRLGAARATHTQLAACQAGHIASLEAALQNINQSAALANDANLRLGQTISARQQADAAATQEIRHALKTTAHLRIDCVFDDGVMRTLAAARDRANTAAARGISNPVPAITGAQ